MSKPSLLLKGRPGPRKDSTQLRLIVIQAGLISSILALLFLHWSDVATYLVFSLAIAITAGASVLKNIDNKTIFVHSFALFMAVRLVYFFATDFRSIPFGDSYWDLGVLKTFLQSNHVFIISDPLYPSRLLTWYSSWPLLHTLEATLVQATGVPAEQFHMLFAIFLSALTFVFSVLFIRIIAIQLKLQTRFIYLAVLLFAISPEAIFWGLAPTRQEFAGLILAISLYLLTKGLGERKRSYIFLTFFCVIALVLAHHFTSAIATGVFASVASLYPPRQFRGTYGVLALVLAVSILLWWTGYATIIFETPSLNILSLDSLNFSLANLRPTTYPDQLSPMWLLVLLRARDVILYFTPVAGAALLLFRRNQPYARFVLILSAAAGTMLILNLSIESLEPTRVLMIFMPIIALLAVFGYSEIATKARVNIKFLSPIICSLVSFVVFVSFVGLWGHDFAPLHLYDNTISSTSVGEHNPTVTYPLQFLSRNVNYDQIDNIVSEFHSSLIMDLPVSQYGKIKEMQDTVPANDGRTLVVSTDNLYVYKYFAGYFAGIDPKDREILKAKLEERLNSFNQVYSDGTNRIWK